MIRAALDALSSWACGGRDPVAARVSAVIRHHLGDDTAVRQFVDEAGADGVSERTLTRVRLALEDRMDREPAFRDVLAAALEDAPLAPPVVMTLAPRQDAVVADDVDVVRPLFFGRDDAEHDDQDGLLLTGFMRTTAFTEAVSGRKNLVVGRKGTGKSAICVRLSKGDLVAGQTRVITPDDAAGAELDRFQLAGLTAPTAKSLIWRYVFAVHAARYLVHHHRDAGRRRPKAVAVLDRFLRDNGELEDLDLYDRIAQASRGLSSHFSLEAFGLKVGVDSAKAPQGVRASRQLDVVESGIRRAFRESPGDPRLLLLVDRIEQIWTGDDSSADMVIGLLLAGKHLAMTYGNAVRCVVFLRSDIYDALDFGDADKFHSDEIRLDWTSGQLRELALARASASLGRALRPDELWGEVFPRRIGETPVADYLFERVLPRPRDVIQLLNQCRDTALAEGHHRITEKDVRRAVVVFSRWKITDLPKEYGVRFPFLRELLAAFRDAPYLLTRESVARLFAPLRQELRAGYPRFEAFFEPDLVIELLYAVGFLGVRRDGRYVYAGASETAIHPLESDFCIHPCFRPALNARYPHGDLVHNWLEVSGSVNSGVILQSGHDIVINPER
ncbi:P-loop ATPase, Sll1717 family [Actinokineospora fastidiosa]|uniref:Uncharacterized protein n=1 Tax=Actinokineospora fastidiosa TaxID=1816 RepID=A0A918GIX2_9PSEU|nr:hypothetical protein [Actinokineospora fastidiosa]GGS35640.1 hypothetical protein GCM10010171_32800 [Actinokineospora fastidiosa]